MGYKALGYVVWHGAKWYVRRRVEAARVKIVAGGLVALLVAGAITALRSRSSD